MYVYTFDWQDDGGYKEIEAENRTKQANENKMKLDNKEDIEGIDIGKSN